MFITHCRPTLDIMDGQLRPIRGRFLGQMNMIDGRNVMRVGRVGPVADAPVAALVPDAREVGEVSKSSLP